jgi:hypothetical protein
MSPADEHRTMSQPPSPSCPRRRLEPQTGTAFLLERGQRLRVIDPLGEQVSDLVAFARDDRWEWLSSGRSIDYANTIYLTTGHVLYSNRSRPMFTIVADDVGQPDFLLTPCSPESFAILIQARGPAPELPRQPLRGPTADPMTAESKPTDPYTFKTRGCIALCHSGRRTCGRAPTLAPFFHPPRL